MHLKTLLLIAAGVVVVSIVIIFGLALARRRAQTVHRFTVLGPADRQS